MKFNVKKSTKKILIGLFIIITIFYFINNKITNINDILKINFKEGNECSDSEKNIASKNNAKLKGLITRTNIINNKLNNIENNLKMNKKYIDNNENEIKKIGENAEKMEKKHNKLNKKK
tara:strand:- start:1917 stop:2273 length:357 start_codon:yes stop_codon:yes gene_type:complete